MEIRVDAAQIDRLANALKAAGKLAPVAVNRALRHTGDKARTKMRRVLVAQTGLKYGVMVRAIKGRMQAGQYVIRSHGGNVRLKFFKSRETRAGVSAAPWNRRRVYPGTFTKGGRFPKRVKLALGGNVMMRTGSGRLPINVQKSGLFIPEEMVQDASRAAFFEVAERDLADRVAHELYRVLPG